MAEGILKKISQINVSCIQSCDVVTSFSHNVITSYSIHYTKLYDHRRAHPDPGDRGLKAAFVLPVIVGDIGGGATHVKTDQAGEAASGGSAGHTDDAASRAGEYCVLALEQRGVGKAAVGLHKKQLWPAGGQAFQLPRHLVDVESYNFV